jgi:hypothetical protein
MNMNWVDDPADYLGCLPVLHGPLSRHIALLKHRH